MINQSGHEDRSPRCPACGYNLHGLPSLRCPECGHEIQTDAEHAYAKWISPANAADRRQILMDRIVIAAGLACFIAGVVLTIDSLKLLSSYTSNYRFRGIAGSIIVSLGILAYYYYSDEDMVRPCAIVGALWIITGLGFRYFN